MLTFVPEALPAMRTLDDIDTIGVVGAGTMGSGIAQVAAANGLDVEIGRAHV